MKTFFNEYNAFQMLDNEDAQLLVNTVDPFLKSVMKIFVDKGYNPREISHWIMLSVSGIEAETVLRNAMDMRREERQKIGQFENIHE